MSRLYECLGLPNFEAFRPSLEAYVIANSGYRKNDYPVLSSSLRRDILQAWKRSFDEWNYAFD